MRRTRKTRRTRRRTRKARRGGAHWLPALQAETAALQRLANAKDPYNRPFLVTGSTAVALFLFELLTSDATYLTATERAEGEAHRTALAKPADLDFKYRRQGPLFDAQAGGGLFDLSALLGSENTTCEDFILLDGFRCCEPWEENPIFKRLPDTESLFEKVEFHTPREYRRKRMPIARIGEVEMLGMADVLGFYETYTRAGENAPKMAVLRWMMGVLERHPELADKYLGSRS